MYEGHLEPFQDLETFKYSRTKRMTFMEMRRVTTLKSGDRSLFL